MTAKHSIFFRSFKEKENLLGSAKLQKFALRRKKNKWAFLLKNQNQEDQPLYSLNDGGNLRQWLELDSLSRRFSLSWKEKQSLKNHYLIKRETTWKAYVTKAKQKRDLKEKAQFSQEKMRFLSFWESRLDLALFKAHFVPSILQGRQWILHGFLKVNGKKVRKPSRLLKIGDKVSLHLTEKMEENLRENLKSTAFFQKSGKEFPLNKYSFPYLPHYLEIHYPSLTFILSEKPNPQQLLWPYPVNLSYIPLDGLN